MAATVTGTVASCNYKNINTKRGTAQIWSFKLEEDQKWYKTGFDKPERPDGVRLLAGDKVRFSFNETQYGNDVEKGTLQIKMVATPSEADKSNGGDGAPAPAKKSFGGGGKKSFGGGQKDDYWAKKEQFDKTVTQPLIMRQAANNVAAQLVSTALEKDVLPLPSKKADKFPAYMQCFHQVSDEIFAEMNENYIKLQEGKSIVKAKEEAPYNKSADDLAAMDDFDTDPEQVSDDWD